jgi:hypothetical protein
MSFTSRISSGTIRPTSKVRSSKSPLRRFRPFVEEIEDRCVPALAAPIILGTIGNTYDPTPDFRWQAVSGANHYDVWVNDATTGQTQIIRDVNVLSTTYTSPLTLQVEHTYTWWVQALSANDSSGWSQAQFKVVNAFTGNYTGSYTGNTTDGPVSGPVTWTVASNGAVTVVDPPGSGTVTPGGDGQFGGTGGFGGFADVNYQFQGTFVVAGASANASGNWNATYTGGSGTGTWTGTRTSVTALETPVPIGPIGTVAMPTPTFTWNAVAGAAYYDLWVDNTSAGYTAVNATNIVGTSYTPAGSLATGSSYAYYIRAHTASGVVSAWTNAVAFNIPTPTPLSAPIVLGTVGNTYDPTPDLMWQPVAGADFYDVWVSDATSGQSQVIRDTHFVGTTYTPTTSLTVNHTYIWYVRALSNAGGLSGWGQGQFSVVNAFTGIYGGTYTGNTTDGPVSGDVAWSVAANGAVTVTMPGSGSGTVTPTGEGQFAATGGGGAVQGAHYVFNGNFTLAGINANANGTWNVVYDGGSGNGTWTGTRNAANVLSTPLPDGPFGTTTNPKPTFGWTTVPGANYYELWVSDAYGSTVIWNPHVVGNSFTPTTALAVGANYQYWLRARTDAGAASAWSNAYSFTIAQLGAPTLTSPVGTITTNTPTFAWTAVAGANAYDVWISDNTTGAQVLRDQHYVGTTLNLAQPLTMGRSYTWWVRALSDAGNVGAWSSGATFSPGIGVPTPTAPTGSGTNAMPNFVWTASPNATTYDLWVSNNSTGQTYRNVSVAATSYTFAQSLSVGSYTFWVRAIAAGGASSAWSTGLSFSITALGTPVLTSPLTNTTNASPTFTWNAVSGATYYDLWVSDTTTGQSEAIRNGHVVGASYVPTTPLAVGHSYQWWVRAFNDSGNAGGWSSGGYFSVTVETPTLLSPSGTITWPRPEFSWNAAANASYYQLEVDDITSGYVAVWNNHVTGVSNIPTTALTANHSYRWWVRAVNDNGAVSAWSSGMTFFIAPQAPLAAPTLTSPTGTISTTLPTFSWNAVTGADYYELWVDNYTTGASKVVYNAAVSGTSYTPVTALTAGQSYQWWVKAYSNSGAVSAWSSTGNFSIAAETVFWVTNIATSGSGSLKQAIINANASTSTPTIKFAIGSGQQTIPLTGFAIGQTGDIRLPNLTRTMTIDGTTQSGYSGTPLIVLSATSSPALWGLRVAAPNCVIRGLSIIGCTQNTSGSGILLEGGASNTTIANNFLGTDPSFSGTVGNTYGVQAGSDGNIIINNVISGNGLDGLSLGNNNIIKGNKIGTNLAGNVALGNGMSGIRALDHNTIGGPNAADRNIISDNSHFRVAFNSAPAVSVGSYNSIENNYIGTDVTGMSAIGNKGGGVSVGSNNTILHNLISASTTMYTAGVGVALTGNSNTVQGNGIGVNLAGAALGNASHGILITGSSNTIGGTGVEDGNTIFNNGADGVAITGSGSIGNAVLGNAIFANIGLGIDLGDNGVTPNGSGPTGPNAYQNYPTITTASIGGSGLHLAGTLNSTANRQFRIEFFSNTAGDSSGYGEGGHYLGYITVTTDAGGAAAFDFVLNVTVPGGTFVTATATDLTSTNTSEFSAGATT